MTDATDFCACKLLSFRLRLLVLCFLGKDALLALCFDFSLSGYWELGVFGVAGSFTFSVLLDLVRLLFDWEAFSLVWL